MVLYVMALRVAVVFDENDAKWLKNNIVLINLKYVIADECFSYMWVCVCLFTKSVRSA